MAALFNVLRCTLVSNQERTRRFAPWAWSLL